MRVLIVSQWYDPEPNVKCHQLARGLIDRGHEVEVLTAFPSYPYGRIYDGYSQRPWSRERLDGVPITRVPSIPDHSRSPFRRAISYGSWTAMASLTGSILMRRPDVVLAYATPIHIAIPALIFGACRRAPVVVEIQDLWPDTLSATGMVSSPTLTKYAGKLTNAIYRLSTRLIVQSRGFSEAIAERGVPEGKIDLIRNWAREEIYFPRPSAPSEDFTIVFAGNLGAAQGTDVLLDAAKELVTEPGIRIVIIGDGIEFEALAARVRDEKISNVTMTGRLPEQELPDWLSRAGALVVHLKAVDAFARTIPSKLMAYMAMGKPVIAAIGGEAAQVVADADAGIVCPPCDHRALAQSIRRLAAMSVAEREELGLNARRFYDANFARDTAITAYEETFRRAISEFR